MDLRELTGRLQTRSSNHILTFEKGRVVRRTHATLYGDVQAARAALESWGVKPGGRVGILAGNCYEWLVHELATLELRAVSVAFTDDFADWPVEKLRETYDLSVLLLKGGKKPPVTKASFVAFLDVEGSTAQAFDTEVEPADDDFEMPALIFSSGSAGGIKGMRLNRRGIELSFSAMAKAIEPRSEDRVLLFLPLSNFQQRLIYYAALWYGTDLILTDPPRLFRALAELRPTILIAPPTLFEAFENRFYNLPRAKRWTASVVAGVIRRLPLRAVREGLARRLFADAYKVLGGRMRFMVTGMAPIKRSTLRLFADMQLPLFETYGLVECGSISLNVPAAQRLGSVGRPLEGVSIELAEDGEILVSKEAMVATGYFQCADGENESTFIGENRVATGDIGRIDGDGFLFLVGRKKEIIITAGGEKVHPEAVESAIGECPLVSRAVVFGDVGATSLSAVVVPKDPADDGAKRQIEQFVEGLAKGRAAMNVGKVVFTDVEFTRENGLLRPNLKLDRRQIGKYFESQLGEVQG